jgi:hypothetical protein
MAKIPIWTGTASFSAGATPFGFYDSETSFQEDAPKVAKWCAQRLGYPLVDIELQDVNFFTAFEEAVTEYGHQVYTYQVINNMADIVGKATSSALNYIELSENYADNSGNTLQGSGTSYNLSDQRLYSASLEVKAGIQKYNLLSSSPRMATGSVAFNTSSLEVSSSIQLTDTAGKTIKFMATPASSSLFFVSSSAGQFETGSSANDIAKRFASAVASSSIAISASLENFDTSTTVNLRQSTEGDGGNSTIVISNIDTSEDPNDIVIGNQFTGGSSGLSFESSGSAIQAGNKKIKVKKIYHHAPAAINRYFDPYAGTGTGIQSLMQSFGFGNYSPGVNFMLMPIYFDVLKLQAIEFNDQIRKSAYHFDLNAGQFLRLFPIPDRDYTLWFEYTMADSATSPATTIGPTGEEEEKDTGLVTDISNAPYTNPTYAYINDLGRQWIRRYALALCKEMLGGIRGKYQALPIPGAETTLDYSRLLSEAQAEKTALIEQLREDLDATTTLRQKERSTQESEQQQALYSADNPYQIYIH